MSVFRLNYPTAERWDYEITSAKTRQSETEANDTEVARLHRQTRFNVSNKAD